MPIFGSQVRERATQLKPSFVERIRLGNVVPIVSGEALIELELDGVKGLTSRYADLIEYPPPLPADLRQMVKHRAVTQELTDWDLKYEFLNLVKNHIYYLAEESDADEAVLAEAEEQVDDLTVTEFAQLLGYPRFADAHSNPLLILADLPLPIFMTTSHYGFMEQALRRAGKEPRSEIVRWRASLDSEPAVLDHAYEPSVQQPLVYHLYGMDTRPDSLVLTEDDLVQFLIAVTQNRGNDTDRVPSRIRQAMLDSAPVLLGFNLPGWDFRALFWGLLKQDTSDQKGIFTLQVEPSPVERQYLQGYLREARFEVFWGDIRRYAQELAQMWKG